jgi:hypothetical protein
MLKSGEEDLLLVTLLCRLAEISVASKKLARHTPSKPEASHRIRPTIKAVLAIPSLETVIAILDSSRTFVSLYLVSTI